MSDRIVLGSGKLYVATASKGSDGQYTIPSDSTLETTANLLGWIQGGATLEYTPEFYEAKDDLGKVSKKYLTNEEAVLKSGIMTWDKNTLAKLASTATTTTNGIKIGGVENYDNGQYVIRFLHEDTTDGDIRVTIVGSNEAGFSIAFAKDKETVIDAEFKAVPHDASGTLIEVEFDAHPTSGGSGGGGASA